MVNFRPLIAPLFVPATRPERFRKAAESGADAIIVDLEDAVPAADKDRARAMLMQGTLKGLPVPVFLRINGRSTAWHGPDLDAAAGLPVAGIMLPKTEGPGGLKLIAQRLGPDFPVIALVETAAGIAELSKLGDMPNLAQIAFGSVDFALDISAAHEPESLAFARGQIVLYSRIHGLPLPIDGVTISTSDTDLLKTDSARAAALGFGGKLAIHPIQIGTIRNAFSPSQKDVDLAKRILEAEKAQQGAVVLLDGIMIDTPIIERARRTLARAADVKRTVP